jgi:hypothetical protein
MATLTACLLTWNFIFFHFIVQWQQRIVWKIMNIKGRRWYAIAVPIAEHKMKQL